MSAPDWDWVHLAALDEGLTDAHRHGTYLALCGELVATSDLPGTLCAGECDRAHAYCLGCLREANERNWEAGVDGDCPPGVVVRVAR